MKLTQTGEYLEISGDGNFVLTRNDAAIQMGEAVRNIRIVNWWFQSVAGGFRVKFRASIAALRYIWR